MKYHLCEFLYGQREELVAKMLNWALTHGRHLAEKDELSPMEKDTLQMINHAFWHLDTPAPGKK